MTRPAEWQHLKMLHLKRAFEKFMAGEPHLDELRESNRCELEALRASGIVERVEIQGCRDSCPACFAFAGREMNLTEALAKAPLPVQGCTHGNHEGWCRCEYLAIMAT